MRYTSILIVAAIVQWQNAALWQRMSWVRNPLAAPITPLSSIFQPSCIPSTVSPCMRQRMRAAGNFNPMALTVLRPKLSNRATRRVRSPSPEDPLSPPAPGRPANLFAGTSGWAYPTWKPGFYPDATVSLKKFLAATTPRSSTRSRSTTPSPRKLPQPRQLAGLARRKPRPASASPSKPRSASRTSAACVDCRRPGRRPSRICWSLPLPPAKQTRPRSSSNSRPTSKPTPRCWRTFLAAHPPSPPRKRPASPSSSATLPGSPKRPTPSCARPTPPLHRRNRRPRHPRGPHRPRTSPPSACAAPEATTPRRDRRLRRRFRAFTRRRAAKSTPTSSTRTNRPARSTPPLLAERSRVPGQTMTEFEPHSLPPPPLALERPPPDHRRQLPQPPNTLPCPHR